MRRFLLGLVLLPFGSNRAAARETVVFLNGSVRIQVLSPRLVRIEQAGPKGFEDRPTFSIQERKWEGARSRMLKAKGGKYSVEVSGFVVSFSPSAKAIAGIELQDHYGSVLFRVPTELPDGQFFPGPSRFPKFVAIADKFRIVPPAWGATPPPSAIDPQSGWDVDNTAPDIYLFLNTGGGYSQFVKDYLKLTGTIELPPLYAFGLIDSRYYPYTQEQALEVIQGYRRRGFPLDMFVLDTDWRIGASKGYQVNKKLWPDLGSFLIQAHELGVRTMFNDHPEPQTDNALDPRELAYRWNGLTSLFRLGADAWWYDRNWITHLKEPVPGLHVEIWGQRLFHDIASRYAPSKRPLIMTNVQGIDNGVKTGAPQLGYHRYPVMWTGDTAAQWIDLRRGVKNAVDGGVDSLLPFISEDLTGHTGKPTTELYVRFMQYGCLSPITRIHCASGQTRFPWDYGEVAESITREMVKLRYRLLPMIYSAARKSHDDGTPLLRRCDLEWPRFYRSHDSSQYILGDDLLVAPVCESQDSTAKDIPAEFLHTKSGEPGLHGEYFSNMRLESQPVVTRTDRTIAFDWGQGSPDAAVPANTFSARWTGLIGPMPETGDYVLGTRTDDGAKLYIDGNLVVSKWSQQDNTTNFKVLNLERGKSYSIEMDYFDEAENASCHLVWLKPSERKTLSLRKVWIPPGAWIDAWDGSRHSGPANKTFACPLWKIPILVRDNALIPMSSDVRSTSEGLWKSPILEVFIPARSQSTERTLYEDDGLSTDYLRGQFATTKLRSKRQGDLFTLFIDPMKGQYSGQQASRQWTVRFRPPSGFAVRNIEVDGAGIDFSTDALPGVELSHTPFKFAGGVSVRLSTKSIRTRRTVMIRLRRTRINTQNGK